MILKNSIKSVSSASKQIVFIDSKVDNYQHLITGIGSDVETIIIDSHSNGIEQITNALRDRPAKSIVHLISHGTPGCLHLGNARLNLNNIKEYQRELRLWFANNSRTVSRHLVLYGCNVAASNVGEKFVDRIGYYTGAEVTASTTPTGNSQFGGNWDLEYATGKTKIPSAIAESVRQNWQGVLAAPFPDAQPDVDTAGVTLIPLNLDLAIGNILTNDDLGDTPARITSVSVQGDNDSLVDLGDISTEVSLLTPEGGTLLMLGNGAYTYTPPVLASGFTEVFNYTITDNDGDTSTSTLTINGNGGGNIIPLAQADINNAIEAGSSVSGELLINDVFGNPPSTISAASQGGSGITLGTAFTTSNGGSLTLNDDGSYDYVPPGADVISAPVVETFNYTITDDDGQTSSSTLAINVALRPTVELDLSSTAGSEADQTEFTITANASSAVSGAQTIDIDTTALDFTDYTLSANQITIADGETSGSVTLKVIDDDEIETDEIIPITLLNPSAGIELGTTTSVSLTIEDNDTPPSLDLDSDDSNTVDGIFQSDFTLGGVAAPIVDTDLTLGDDGELASVEVVLTNAQAGDELLIDSLLGSLPATVSSNLDTSVAGEVKLTLSPAALVDSLPAATFQTALSLVGFNTTSTDTTDREISVIANDTDGNSTTAQANIEIALPTVELDLSQTVGNEGDQTEFTITANASSAVSGEQTIDIDTTALDFTDYTLSANQITIADGETSGSVTLTVIDDDEIEGDEVIPITLLNPSAGIELGTTTTASLTIEDNDIPPSLDLDGDDDNTVDGIFQSDFTLGGVAAPIVDTDLTLGDDGNLASVEVVLTNAQAEDLLAVDLAALPTISSQLDTSVTGEVKLTLSPTALVDSLPAATFQTALSLVGFNTTSTDTTDRVISVIANDTDGNSTTAQASIAVTASDIDPVAQPDTDISSGILGFDFFTGNVKLDITTGNVINNDEAGNAPALVTSASVRGGASIALGTAFVTSQGGTLLLAANGSYVYTPPALGLGDPGITEVFEYTITDLDGDTSTSTLTIDVNGGDPTINDPPTLDLDRNNNNTLDGVFRSDFTFGGLAAAVADTDLSIVNSDSSQIASVEVVLTNAQADDELIVDSLLGTLPTSIDVAANSSTDGEIKLTLSAANNGAPAAAFETALSLIAFNNTNINADSTEREISITATDTNGNTSVAAQTKITVSPAPNVVPVAKPDLNFSNSILEIDLQNGDLTLDIVNGNIITNDRPGNTPTVVTSASVQGGNAIALGTASLTPNGGILLLAADGSYVYTPPNLLNDEGIIEVFDYTITDLDGESSSSTLTINVKGNDNTVPVSQPDTNLAVEAGGTINANLLANDDLGDTPTTVSAASQGNAEITLGTPFVTANGGSLTLAADGSYSYIPADAGSIPSTGVTETFNYTITDSNGDTSDNTLVITVEQAAPVANSDSIVALTGEIATVNVLNNDRNEGENNPTSVTVEILDETGNPANEISIADAGTWSVQANGSIQFTPEAGFTGDIAPISYQFTDADGQTSNSAEIGISYRDIIDSNVAIERVSTDVFYTNPDNGIVSNYAAYKITNTSEADIEDLYVEIDNFTGSEIRLAANESNLVNLGSLASGETATAFFYLTADGATTVEQSHTVSAYDGNPTAQGTLQGDADFSFTGVEAVTAAEIDTNEVNSVTFSTNPVLPGDEVIVIVEGETGVIGEDGILSFSPASFTDWNPDNYELVDTSITFDGGTIGTVNNELLIETSDRLNLPYTAVYTFETSNTVSADANLSPIGNISSGTTIQHTNTANFDTFDTLQFISSTGTVAGTIWDDANFDGILDVGENTIPNAKVNLYRSSLFGDKLEATATTDATGAYQFTEIPSGNYYLEFIEPKGYVAIPENRDDLISLIGLRDSDFNTATGRTDIFRVSPNETVENLNAGFASDSDGDTIPNFIEGLEADRDNDAVPNYLDVDPTGYFYSQITGEVLTGGKIAVSGAGEAKIKDDGSTTGAYQWQIDPDFPGVYDLEITPPEGYILSPERLSQLEPVDATTLSNESIAEIGSGKNDNTGKLVSTNSENNKYYLSFDIASEDPYLINNNIPLVAPPSIDLDSDNSSGATGNSLKTLHAFEDEPVSVIDSSDTQGIIDLDNINIQSATIKLKTRPDGDAAESLSIDGTLPTGIEAVPYDEVTGILQLNGDAPLASYQTALAQVEYSNSIGLKTGDRLIDITLNDGISDSNTATSIIDIDVAPTIDLNESNNDFI